MKKVIWDGEEFDLPERAYTGKELQSIAGASSGDIPVIRNTSGDRDDVIVEPDEKFSIGENDVVTFTSPMEAA